MVRARVRLAFDTAVVKAEADVAATGKAFCEAKEVQSLGLTKSDHLEPKPTLSSLPSSTQVISRGLAKVLTSPNLSLPLCRLDAWVAVLESMEARRRP